jgi:hypothetical protein
MGRDLLRFAFPDLTEKIEIVAIIALRERENGRRLDHHKGLGACDRAAKTAAG